MLWRIERITGRFLAIMIAVSALMAAPVAGLVAWLQVSEERQRVDAYMADIARLNAAALVEPVWTINEAATRSIVLSLSAQMAVSCAQAEDAAGNRLASTQADGCTNSQTEPNVVGDIVHDGQILGRLVLWLDEGQLRRRLGTDVRLAILVFVLLTGAMVVTSVFALRATVMDPLRRLIMAVRRARRVTVNAFPHDELGQVITAYNSLLDRVNAHTSEVEEARSQAVAAAQAKSRFLATMSHEIRTPMHGVLGTVELLRETELSSEQRKFADVILHSTEALLGIINDILDLSKIEAGKAILAPAPASPSRIAQEVVGALAATARAKGIALDLAWAPETPCWMLADPLRLRQVVMNLVGNAVKFTETGAVTVSLGRENGQLVIQVSDTGIGIAPDMLSRLFEPFQQGDASTTRRYGGTGLGLSISHQLVELMGGSIQVESTPDQGSVFRVVLPLVETEAPSASTMPALPTVSSGGGARVLAAEDNPVNQWLLRSQLERLGYRADIYSDGKAALAAFTPGHYAAVITDYHMPIMDGLDLARAIRAAESPALPPIPIIGMTADAFAETVEECRRAGMDVVVTKPISLEDLGVILARRISGEDGPAKAPVAGPAGLSVADAPLLDSEITAAVFGDDPEGRADMTALFVDTVNGLRDGLTNAMAARQRQDLTEAAHSLASAALSLGATRLGLTARALEMAAKAGDWASCERLYARISMLDEQTRAALAG